MEKKAEAPSRAGCTQGHEITMKKIQILQEHAKIKIIFRRRSPLGDFPPKLPKLSFEVGRGKKGTERHQEGDRVLGKVWRARE